VKIKTFLTKTGHKTIAPETAGILENRKHRSIYCATAQR